MDLRGVHISLDETTVGRELSKLGFRNLSARPDIAYQLPMPATMQ